MPSLRPLRRETLAVQAADAIRELIAAGHVTGGDRLVESRLAGQLGVSRGPVRDALRLLTQEGLVRDEPRRGTFVVRLTEQDIVDVYDLRIAVETAAVRLLLRHADGEPLEVLQRTIGDMRAVARMDEEELPHPPGATVAEHEELLDALTRGPEAAEAAFRAHLEQARDRVAAYVRANG